MPDPSQPTPRSIRLSPGPILRRMGLLLEFVGVFGILNDRGKGEVKHFEIPGLGSVSIAAIAFAVGFGLWLTGAIIASRSRPKRTQPSDPTKA